MAAVIVVIVETVSKETGSDLGDASIQVRRAAIPTVLEAFKSVPTAFEGAMDLGIGLVEKVRVARGDFVGPSFDIDAGGAVGDPTIDQIRGKFQKQYDVDLPLELVAHYELHPMFPDEVWVPRVRAFVSGALAKSPFERVWIFDGARGSIRFVYPD